MAHFKWLFIVSSQEFAKISAKLDIQVVFMLYAMFFFFFFVVFFGQNSFSRMRSKNMITICFKRGRSDGFAACTDLSSASTREKILSHSPLLPLLTIVLEEVVKFALLLSVLRGANGCCCGGRRGQARQGGVLKERITTTNFQAEYTVILHHFLPHVDTGSRNFNAR